MNFSDQWRSLFPIPTTFSSPSLLSSPSHGPLLFLPSHQSQPLSLLPPLQIPTPLPSSSNLHAIQSLSSFLPYSAQLSLSSQIPSPSSPNPVVVNHLLPLRRRSSPSTSLLFFPTGDNSHSIGFLLLSFSANKVEIRDRGVQKDGFKHAYHRISKMSVVPASDEDVVLEAGVTIEGFLIAATLYSVNWFRVETRVLDSGQERVVLVPTAKQGFRSLVVDARLSPHSSEESVVLLENGELCWFDMEGKRSGKVMVSESLGGWLGCEYGGQPWVVVVACSSSVLMVDLREKKGRESKVLFLIEDGKEDQILAFCKSSFDSFLISVVTDKQLLLVDMRQPLVPVMIWDHGLNCPCYVSMFRLSELRPPSENFRWASDSGSVIMVGSFWKGEFSIFCYGPREGGTFGDSSILYAWELSFTFALSSRQCRSGDSLVREDLLSCSEPKQSNDMVVGFWIVPNDLLRVESEYGGFGLIRLMLSGKLEMQKYHASWDLVSKSSNEGEECPKLENSIISSMGQEGKVYSHNYFLNIRHLWEYMNGTLPSVFSVHKPQLGHYNRNLPSNHLMDLADMKQKCSTCPISKIISDATVPTNIFEITLRRVLNGLELDLLPIAFSKYSLLFENRRETSFSLLEVPRCLSHHRLIPFFVSNPFRKIEKLSKRALPWETLVAPIFPIHVILILQWLDHQKIYSHLNEDPDDDLLTLQCRTTLENIYPEVSLADSGKFTEWDSQGLENDKNFFVHEKSVVGNISNCKVKEELPRKESTCLESEGAFKDEKFTTFICGIADKKASNSNSGKDAAGLEMFDQLNPFRLDFESHAIVFQPKEQEMYKRLMRQNSRWLGNYKPFENFCTSTNIPKPS